MPRYVALLRAINVGGHTVKMDRLRDLFTAAGLASVETYIASGNVIFESDETDAAALERRIEAHLEAALGYAVGTFLRTPAELAAAAAREPFPRTDGDALYVNFLRTPADPAAQARLAALETPSDRFSVAGRELYWWVAGRMSDSKITGPKLEKAAGQPMTSRNVTTVRTLAQKYGH